MKEWPRMQSKTTMKRELERVIEMYRKVKIAMRKKTTVIQKPSM
jgi:hypothetical protein